MGKSRHKKKKRALTSSRPSANKTKESHLSPDCTVEPVPGPASFLPEFLRVRATPTQLREFIEALHLIFEQPVPTGVHSDPAGSGGAMPVRHQ